jgi:integrase
MASASITTRMTKAGKPKYEVRYRLGGRAYPVEHGGSFATMREARIRRDLIAGELAAGRNPRILLDSLAATPTPLRTFAQWAEAYQASRVDYAAETTKNAASHVKAMLRLFGDRDPATITTSDVQEWIAGLVLKPSSVRRYLATLRAVLDYAGVDPNPAKDHRIRLPREQHTTIEPPSSGDVEAIILHSPARWRLVLMTLAETGMRVGELHHLEWRDVDQAAGRFRVRNGKTAAARRWVTVPDDLMAEIAASTPPDDRTAERRVFQGATPNAVKNVMDRACKAAGIAHYHPHDLRHRYASVQIARGVPVTTLAAALGHSRKSLTLDTYSHVLLAD